MESVKEKLNPKIDQGPVLNMLFYVFFSLYVLMRLFTWWVGRAEWMNDSHIMEFLSTGSLMISRMLFFGILLYLAFILCAYLARKTNTQDSLIGLLLLPIGVWGVFIWLMAMRWGLKSGILGTLYAWIVIGVPFYLALPYSKKMGMKGTYLTIKPEGIDLGQNYFGPYDNDSEWRKKRSILVRLVDHHENEVLLWWGNIKQIRPQFRQQLLHWVIETKNKKFYVCMMADKRMIEEATRRITAQGKDRLVKG